VCSRLPPELLRRAANAGRCGVCQDLSGSRAARAAADAEIMRRLNKSFEWQDAVIRNRRQRISPTRGPPTRRVEMTYEHATHADLSEIARDLRDYKQQNLPPVTPGTGGAAVEAAATPPLFWEETMVDEGDPGKRVRRNHLASHSVARAESSVFMNVQPILGMSVQDDAPVKTPCSHLQGVSNAAG